MKGSTRTAGAGISLSLRLALILSVAVLAVLLVAGVVVNRVVSGSFEDVVSAQQADQLQAAADALAEVLRQGGSLREARSVLARLSHSLGAPVAVRGPAGEMLLELGPPLPRGVVSRELSSEVIVDGRPMGSVTASVPSPGADRPFLRIFNIALVLVGLVSVVLIAGLAVLIARRATRPIREVADAAERLESGELGARVVGGGDRESQELAGAFNAMAARLERSEMLRRRAASDMAHDLATPATVLQSQLQAMIDGVVPADAAQLESARASADALGSVIVQMGELALAEAAPLQARPERVELAPLLAAAAQSLDGLYRERGVSLAVEAGDPGLAVRADPSHLGRALRNVLTNAAQHAPLGGSVRVSAVAGAAAGVEIRVIDDGPGIPAHDLPHVFERFYRADPARAGRAGAGAGIGLTIARELLTASRGTIRVEASGSGGTTFLIGLPPG